jgi:hypothetical protein
MQYADDPKRVFNWLIRDKTAMCEIDPEIFKDFSMIDGKKVKN